jgi:hypothetical protein
MQGVTQVTSLAIGDRTTEGGSAVASGRAQYKAILVYDVEPLGTLSRC